MTLEIKNKYAKKIYSRKTTVFVIKFSTPSKWIAAAAGDDGGGNLFVISVLWVDFFDYGPTGFGQKEAEKKESRGPAKAQELIFFVKFC